MQNIHKCECGCGMPTAAAPRSRKELGWIKGHPLKYVVGHSKRRRVRIGPRGTAWCNGTCQSFKPVRDFAKSKRNRNRLQGVCRKCSATIAKKYRKHHRVALIAHTRRHNLKRHFGITPDVYNSMFSAQNGLCALCGNPETALYKGNRRRLAVDHDHTTGKIRGLLCTRCNNGIGAFGDSINLLKTAISYLQKHRS